MQSSLLYMKRIFLSPSRLSLFLECPRCFWLDINRGVKRPSGIFPSLPSGMDSILKKYFDGFRCNGCLPPELEDKLKGHLFDDMEKLNIWRNNFKGLQYIDEKSGIGLRGALDDLFVTDDKLFVPLDFKTRGFPLKEDTHEHYQHQMDIYCFLLDVNGNKTGNFACLLFYHPIMVEDDGRVKFKSDFVKVKTSKENGEKMFMNAIEVILGEEPECKEGCPFCNWNKN